MALRARLASLSAPEQERLPVLAPKWTDLPSHLFWKGGRRMEAENYLSTGYGLRLAIEERAVGWQRLNVLADVWQPSRLKGIQVRSDVGTPFLAATQVFDIRPVARKWLALARTSDAANRYVTAGTILVTCSGAVGRATLAHDPHAETLISHDLLRVAVRDSEMWGWVYAFLRSPQARAMMSGAQYGHIIKHLETAHLDALPVPVVREKIAEEFQKRANEILSLRNRAYHLMRDAEARFEMSLGMPRIKDWGEDGFEIRASSFFRGRRRLEAIPHSPGVAAVWRHLAKHGHGFTSVGDAGFNVWLPGRFKRIPASDGIELVDSSAVFEINPDHERRIADGDFGDTFRGRVQAGWLLMARSGQTYGLNGSVAFATVAHEGRVVSDDLLRIAGKNGTLFPPGYLFVALSHPLFGRPLVKSLAYGSSIPHMEAADLLSFQVVRLPSGEELAISNMSEESARDRARADVLEREMAADAGQLIEKFLEGETAPFLAEVSPRQDISGASP
jgi:hypothetical protein